MKITINHDQSSIDPGATVPDEQFPEVRDSLEKEYTKAIKEEYPDAEIEFSHVSDTYSFRVSDVEPEDQQEIEDDIQRITELVYETGLFWS